MQFCPNRRSERKFLLLTPRAAGGDEEEEAPGAQQRDDGPALARYLLPRRHGDGHLLVASSPGSDEPEAVLGGLCC